jgi:hypothetical protein
VSLDVYLHGPPERQPCGECGHVREIRESVYSANITHNLSRMAGAAGIYEQLWRPQEIGIEKARELIAPLRAGLSQLLANETYFRQFDATNGWGTYPNFVEFVRKYLSACEENPDADVSVWA